MPRTAKIYHPSVLSRLEGQIVHLPPLAIQFLPPHSPALPHLNHIGVGHVPNSVDIHLPLSNVKKSFDSAANLVRAVAVRRINFRHPRVSEVGRMWFLLPLLQEWING